MRHIDVSDFSQIGAAWIGNDKLGSVIELILFDFHPDDRMVFSGIGSTTKIQLASFQFTNGIGHGSASECCPQTGDSNRVSEAGAMVYVIGP